VLEVRRRKVLAASTLETVTARHVTAVAAEAPWRPWPPRHV